MTALPRQQLVPTFSRQEVAQVSCYDGCDLEQAVIRAACQTSLMFRLRDSEGLMLALRAQVAVTRRLEDAR